MNGVGRMAAARAGQLAASAARKPSTSYRCSRSTSQSPRLGDPVQHGRARLCQSLTELLTEPAVTCHAITGGATKPGQTSQSGQ